MKKPDSDVLARLMGCWLSTLACVAPAAAASLKQCAAIDAPADRLSCYDQLAGRPASATAATTPAATNSVPAPAVAPVSAPDTKESFGLHAVSPAPVTTAVTAKVVTLTTAANGHRVVTLEDGQLWELITEDPLIASGNTVIIKRGALGSFLMTTPSGRTDRVHRLR